MNYYIEDEIELRYTPIYEEIQRNLQEIHNSEREIEILEEQLLYEKDPTERYNIEQWIITHKERIELFQNYNNQLGLKGMQEIEAIIKEAKAIFERNMESCESSSSSNSSYYDSAYA